MEVLNSRILLRPADPEATTSFYRDALGLAVHREFPGGTVFFLGGGYLEVSGHSATDTADTADTGAGTAVWMQVRDLTDVAAELSLKGVRILRGPRREPWGLDEMWIADPDGVRIVLVEVPAEHPMRRDPRSPD